ncbi:MAG: hypothetical protein HYV99_06555 [Betaproteobacteria bacterium]|nr:hypothetical protein [Betaproteobacteria bacterium]
MSLVALLWLLGGVIVAALLISAPIILIARLFPSFRKVGQAEQEAKARARERLAEYARAGLQISRQFLREKVISGQHDGVRFEHYIIPAGKNTPARTMVSIPTTTPGELHVRPETGGTEVVKQLGMVDEFQTGDASFDRKYYFSGTTDEYVRAVFGIRENLERVRALFAGGLDELEKSGTDLVASRPGAELLGIAELKIIVEQLAKLRLPPVVPGEEAKSFVGKQALYALRAVMAVIGLIGAAGFYVARPLLDGWIAFAIGVLPVVAALCAAILAAAYFGLKGRSMAARGMIELLGALPILAMALVCTLALANERFDSTEAEEHEVRLVKRYATTGSKGAVYYHVEFESWRGRGREEFVVPGATYDLAREGQVWRVRVRRGWLAHLWVESMGPRK